LRIVIITDAWYPQVNGVVTTLKNTCDALRHLGHTVKVIDPSYFKTYPCPGYPQVGLAFLCGPKLRPIIEAFKPDAIHIVAEGSVGYAARRYCRHKDFDYTSSLHSRFPEYLNLRIGFPLSISKAYLWWFHRKSVRVMVATKSLENELAGKGYRRLARWSRGVDTELFRPRTKTFIQDARPIFMYTGRVAVEKNVEAFLQLDLPGTKYVVGDGPQRQLLETKYPDVRFVGYQKGEALGTYMAAADVFVFPSRTDTFGLVILEALASGVPVAAYPVQGPKDLINDPTIGVLDSNLGHAALACLKLDPEDCRRFGLKFSWESCAQQFVDNLTVMDKGCNVW